MSPKFAKLTAVVAGVLLLAVPSAIFNHRLVASVEQQANAEMAIAARRTIALVETRIAQALAILDDLAARRIDSCAPDHIDALRQATFATTPVKEISIIAPDGSTLCSDLGGSPERREVISSEPAGAGTEAWLDVVWLGDRPGQAVRIRRAGQNGDNGMAALIPAELLIPEDFPQAAPRSGPFAINFRLATRGGTIIREHIVQPEDASTELLSEKLPSGRYAVEAMVSLPRASLAAREDELRTLGSMVTGGLALIIFGFLLLIPKRPKDNPIGAIEEGLEAGEFVPYYQPIVDIRTGRLRGAEVLTRWRKPDGTVLLPAGFIPLAESSGIILDFTRLIMRQVAKDLGRTLATRPYLRVSFNVTAAHFANEQIADDINRLFRDSPLRLSQIGVEITERQPIESLEETRRTIAALQRLGVQVAIDDVGAGHSGLSYMLKLGVDVIKIDKMFVDSLGADGNSAAIMRTLIELGQSLRMDIVAEGVETYEQVVQLRNLGIRAVQGYVFAPPLPCSSFIQLVEAIDPLPNTTNGTTSAAPAMASAGQSLRRSA